MRKNEGSTMGRMSLGKFLIAVCLVGLGILLLLVNMRIISMEITEAIVYFYPVLFVLIGFKWLIEALFSKRRKGNWFWGLVFFAVGLLLMADRFGWIDFSFAMIWKLWPILFVYIGMKMLTGIRGKAKFKADVKKGQAEWKKEFKQKHKERVVNSMVYNSEGSTSNQAVEPLSLHSWVVNYENDFTRAFIPDKETPIYMSGWVGNIEILIPEDLEFSITSNSSINNVEIGEFFRKGAGSGFSYQTEKFESAERRLKFQLDFKVLNLAIRRV